MAKDVLVSVKEAVHKLQLHLLEGIEDENKLFTAGSLISKSDYQDVVTERSIANICGYPLCTNALPSDRSGRKTRYRISLKEHKVYDLQETYMYCSTNCLVESKAFAETLQEERCTVLNPSKLDEILSLFGEDTGEVGEGKLGKSGDSGLSELRITEKENVEDGVVSMEEWVGPSDAIEGYVPQKDRVSKVSGTTKRKEVVKARNRKPAEKTEMKFNEFDFTSAIITQDEYSFSKLPSQLAANGSGSKVKNLERGETNDQFAAIGTEQDLASSSRGTKFEEQNQEKSVINMIDKLSISEVSDSVCQSSPVVNIAEAIKGTHYGIGAECSAGMLKPSLKSSSSRKTARTVTWADEKIAGKKLCEVNELEDPKNTSLGTGQANVEDYYSARFASAEAVAAALTQAAEAVASGDSYVPDAVSDAGIIVIPAPMDDEPMDVVEDEDEDVDVDEDMDVELEPAVIKWPKKQGITHSDFLDASHDSWFDGPPEGFSLSLSPFATMFMALFGWISSSSLAYIYGPEERSHEEYLSVNGREYPRKVIAMDGRSSEIKQTLAGCIARTLPEVVGNLCLPVPVSTLENRMFSLLDTMSFMDSLPPFKAKQWQLIVVLFVDALSVSRIPSIAPYMTSRRNWLHKVLDDAQINIEEYEVLKDLLIPLGRVPQFSAQSGG